MLVCDWDMCRGRELRTLVIQKEYKVMQNWNSEKCLIKVGGKKIILKGACIKGGVRVRVFESMIDDRIEREAKSKLKPRCLGWLGIPTSFSKMVFVLTLPIILSKILWLVVLATD